MQGFNLELEIKQKQSKQKASSRTHSVQELFAALLCAVVSFRPLEPLAGVWIVPGFKERPSSWVCRPFLTLTPLIWVFSRGTCCD